MRHFVIVIEETENNYSAYSPDLPGCVATGDTIEETKDNMVSAIRMHIEGLEADNVGIAGSAAVATELVYA